MDVNCSSIVLTAKDKMVEVNHQLAKKCAWDECIDGAIVAVLTLTTLPPWNEIVKAYYYCLII